MTQKDQRAAFDEAWKSRPTCPSIREEAYGMWKAAVAHGRQQATKQLFAAKRVIESLETRLTLATKELDDLKKNTNPSLLASEREANAILTDELERQQRREPVAKVVTSVPHLRSIVVQAIPGAEIPPQDALLYAAPQPTEPVRVLSNAEIREILLANGFTIKPGHDDLKPYVYQAIRALLARYGARPRSAT